jgi:hypothetical protein
MHFCVDEMVAIIAFLGAGSMGAKMLAIKFHLWWTNKISNHHKCHLDQSKNK